MLGSRKAQKAEVLSHWYTLVDHLNIPSKEFYSAVEKELEHRQVPGLTISRVAFSEGSALSANRQYLRMKRERLVFDICAAPFGTSYFFSMRFAELPEGTSWGLHIGAVVGVVIATAFFAHLLGTTGGLIIGFILLIFLVSIAGSFHNETYYRQDTRLMYLEIVNTVVKQRVAEFTSARGINLLNIRQHSPLMDNLYRTTEVSVEAVETPIAPPIEPVAP